MPDRWNPNKQEYVNRLDIDKFINEVLEVCKKHGFSISSGEYINSFEIVDYNPEETDLMNAVDMTGEKA